MQLPMLAQDKANHHVYGSWIAGVTSAVVLVLALLCASTTVAVLAGPAAIAMALLAGVVNERLQRRENERAEEEGRPPPHEVSAADVRATVLGSVPVALPLMAVALAVGLSHRIGG